MADDPRLRVAVVGAGALGQLFATLLSLSGKIDVCVITRREEAVAAIADSGVTVHNVTGAGGDLVSRPAAALPADVAGCGGFDVALLLHKAEDSDWAIDMGFGLVGPDGIVISLQNGLRTAEAVERADRRGVAGTTYQAATYVDTGVVEWTLAGPTLLAPRPGALAAAERLVSAAAASLDLRIAPDRDAMLWEKLFGAVANVVSGALLLPVSALMRTPSAWAVMERARDEVLSVASALGVAIDGDVLRARFAARPHAVVGRATGSTYQSLSTGRGGEVDIVVGDVVTRARAVGVATPVLETLADLARVRLELTSKPVT